MAGEAGLRDAVPLRAPLISWEAERKRGGGGVERGMERKTRKSGVGVFCGPLETTLNLWLAWMTVESQHSKGDKVRYINRTQRVN